MNNEIEVGEWIRTNNGVIGKLIRIERDDIDTSLKWHVFNDGKNERYINKPYIVKHSKNKIDLVECGDYVNGWKVLAKTKIKNNEMQVCILTCFEDEHWITINNETLKTIVTKESFKEREYVF